MSLGKSNKSLVIGAVIGLVVLLFVMAKKGLGATAQAKGAAAGGGISGGSTPLAQRVNVPTTATTSSSPSNAALAAQSANALQSLLKALSGKGGRSGGGGGGGSGGGKGNAARTNPS